MERRRKIQEAHNAAHGIKPASIRKSVEQVRLVTRVADARTEPGERPPPVLPAALSPEDLIAALEQQMREAAADLDFELAAELRDQIFELKAAGATPAASAVGANPGKTRTRRPERARRRA
jgi:excinuclease ABC subunit B